MTNKFRKLFACSALATASGVVPAFGADADPMHVSVPFAFKAGKTTLPAGDYVVMEENSGVVVIKGLRGNAMLLTTAGPANATGSSSLSFAHDDEGYVLRSVRAPGRNTCNLLPVTP